MYKVSDKETYSAIVQLVAHAESISWNRFHNFLIANSVLVLAWVTIYVSNGSSLMLTCILVAICVLGVLSGIFWAALGYRGRKFVDGYIDLGTQIEKGIEGHKPLTESKNTRDALPCGWSGSRYILMVGPCIFALFFVLLLVASLTR